MIADLLDRLMPFAWILGYAAIFYALLFAYILGKKRRRRVRQPLQVKLRRPPGYSLERRIRQWDDDSSGLIIFTPLLPIFYGGLVIVVLELFVTGGVMLKLALGTVVFASALAWTITRFLQKLRQYSNNSLGLYGERIVGEALLPFYREGYEVFHDVPANGRDGKAFNLDHVTVGPTGVCLIETKTRRKGRTIAGRKDHEVVFDGKQLVWPWGEDRHGLEQAANQADWLEQWIFEKEGFRVKVLPILALPGWWVTERVVGRLRVANHKQLPAYIRAQRNGALTSEQVDRISRRLDERVRDVE